MIIFNCGKHFDLQADHLTFYEDCDLELIRAKIMSLDDTTHGFLYGK